MRVTDEELVGIIRKQPDPMQSSEMALLISRYSHIIRLKAVKLGTKDIESEDLCQEGYLALFDALRAFDEKKGSFSAFAGTCISNRMKNAVIKARGKLTKDDDFDIGQVADEGTSADDYIISKEANEGVEHLLSFLSPLEYDVMKLFIDGYSYKQIAEKLSITPKSADNALLRARKKLKQLL